MKSKQFKCPLLELQQRELNTIMQKLTEIGLAEVTTLYGVYVCCNLQPNGSSDIKIRR